MGRVRNRGIDDDGYKGIDDGYRDEGRVDGRVDVSKEIISRLDRLIDEIEGILAIWVIPYFVKQFLERLLNELRWMRDRLLGELL